MENPAVKYGVVGMGPSNARTATAGEIPGSGSEWNSAAPGGSLHSLSGVYPEANDMHQRTADVDDKVSTLFW